MDHLTLPRALLLLDLPVCPRVIEERKMPALQQTEAGCRHTFALFPCYSSPKCTHDLIRVEEWRCSLVLLNGSGGRSESAPAPKPRQLETSEFRPSFRRGSADGPAAGFRGPGRGFPAVRGHVRAAFCPHRKLVPRRGRGLPSRFHRVPPSP